MAAATKQNAKFVEVQFNHVKIKDLQSFFEWICSQIPFISDTNNSTHNFSRCIHFNYSFNFTFVPSARSYYTHADSCSFLMLHFTFSIVNLVSKFRYFFRINKRAEFSGKWERFTRNRKIMSIVMECFIPIYSRFESISTGQVTHSCCWCIYISIDLMCAIDTCGFHRTKLIQWVEMLDEWFKKKIKRKKRREKLSDLKPHTSHVECTRLHAIHRNQTS